VRRGVGLLACAGLGAGLALGGCASSSGDDDATACGGGLVAGDLVLSEVMANPAGDDDGSEWFEIYNASTTALDLAGVSLVLSKTDGSDEKLHTMTELVVEPGDYVVVGDVLTELKPAWVDYGYGNDLGSMVNGGGLLAVQCDGDAIDELAYPEADSAGGVSTILDGNIAPDALANDDAARLCASTSGFAEASNLIGSPGEANDACNVTVPGTCLDRGSARPVVSPALGDLVLTEVMADPEGADGDQEWFEVYVATAIDLNGVTAGLSGGSPKLSVDDPECVPVPAGSFLLFAGSADPALNGGLPEVDQVFNFTLKNDQTSTGPGSLFVGLGEEVFDAVTWTASDAGVSRALDPGLLDATSNDDEANWTACQAPYGVGGTGSPGASNDNCAAPAAMCDDGGSMRAIVSPGVGDILIDEVLADPDGTGTTIDPGHEWFELRATASFDLNGLQIGTGAGPAVKQTLSAAECLEVTSGDLVLFGHGADAGANGGLPTVDFVKTFTMTNTGTSSSLFLAVDGTELHRLDYPDTSTTTDGKAFQLDPDGTTTCVTPETTPYGSAANLGTPGDANPACP
jgi:hypothetical protein